MARWRREGWKHWRKVRSRSGWIEDGSQESWQSMLIVPEKNITTCYFHLLDTSKFLFFCVWTPIVSPCISTVTTPSRASYFAWWWRKLWLHLFKLCAHRATLLLALHFNTSSIPALFLWKSSFNGICRNMCERWMSVIQKLPVFFDILCRECIFPFLVSCVHIPDDNESCDKHFWAGRVVYWLLWDLCLTCFHHTWRQYRISYFIRIVNYAKRDSLLHRQAEISKSEHPQMGSWSGYLEANAEFIREKIIWKCFLIWSSDEGVNPKDIKVQRWLQRSNVWIWAFLI